MWFNVSVHEHYTGLGDSFLVTIEVHKFKLIYAFTFITSNNLKLASS